MKPVQKLFLIITALLLFSIFAGFILQFTVLPGLVQKKIIRSLNESGFSDAQVKVKSVTYWGAELENLNIGLEKKFKIKRITVSYSLWSLVKGKVNAINLYGAQVNLGVKNSVIDLGPLSGIAGGGKSAGTLILPFAALFLKESSLFLNVEGQTMMVPLEAAFRDTGNNTGNIELQARIKNAHIKTNAIVDLKTQSFKSSFTITALDLDELKIVSAVFPTLKSLSGQGQLNSNGNLAYQNGQVTGAISVTGDRLSIEGVTTNKPLTLAINNLSATAAINADKKVTLDLSTSLFATQVGGYDLTLTPVSLKSKTTFEIESGHISRAHSVSTLTISRVFNESLGIAGKNLFWSLPYDWKEKQVDQGSMTIEAVDAFSLSLSKITSSFQFNKNELKMTVKSSLGPGATVNATGNFYFDRQGVTGKINGNVPEFTTQNKKWLANLIPPIKDDELSGTLSADARLKIEQGQVLQRYIVDLKDGAWKKAGADTGVQGITGVLGLTSIAPLITDGEQSLTFTNAHTGRFKVEKVQAVFNFAKNDIIDIKSLEMNWASGKISSKDIRFDFSQPHIAFDLKVDALNLQDILDFMEYQGVKGDGRIYGHVPVTFAWGKHPRLSFGDGYLEAKPPQGGLQFSKETAMKILGIAKDIDPKTKNEQEIVSLMMLRALQDMEYSQLKVVFKNDENKILKTRVQAQGYGPRSQKENRVPIGGLDITISSLDELLNRMVLPQLMKKN